MTGENMHNATAQMVTSGQVKPRNLGRELGYGKRKKKTRWYRLRLVIDEVHDLRDEESNGYDLDNSKPWPLGHYNTEREAMAQRNAIVMIDPPSTGDPKRDKLLLDGGKASVSEGTFASPDALVPIDQTTLAAKMSRRRKRKGEKGK